MDPSQKYERSARESNRMNPDTYRSMSDDISFICKRLSVIEEETKETKGKVGKIYHHIMADPERGTIGMIKEVSDNTKNIDKLFQTLEMEAQIRKLEKNPERLEKVEEEVSSIKKDIREGKLIESTKKEDQEEYNKKESKRTKISIWIIGGFIAFLAKVIDFVLSIYFK